MRQTSWWLEAEQQGYASAISARHRGAEVIMVEKAPLQGGTTLRSGGGLWIPNNRFQREKGIEDRREDAIRYMARDSFPQLYNPEDPRFGLPENEYNLITTYGLSTMSFPEEQKIGSHKTQTTFAT